MEMRDEYPMPIITLRILIWSLVSVDKITDKNPKNASGNSSGESERIPIRM